MTRNPRTERVGIIDIIGFGALNADNVYQVTGMLPDGEQLIEGHGRFAGGSAANTIYALAKLGMKTGYIGAVGDDEDGEMLLESFKEAGVDTSHIKVKQGINSGKTLCMIHRAKRTIYVSPEANSLLRKEDIQLNYTNRAKLIHFSSFADDDQFHLQRWVVDNLAQSVKVSFSPGALYVSRGLHSLFPILRRTYVLFINEKELHDLTGEAEYRVGARYLLRITGCRIVVVTLGKGKRYRVDASPPKPRMGSGEQLLLRVLEGQPGMKRLDESLNQENGNKRRWRRLTTYVVDQHGEYAAESRPCSVVDTTGAGDAFAAGFLHATLENRSLKESADWGNAIAWFCIQAVGARTRLPSLADLTAVYSNRAFAESTEEG